jgi:hypothetical protein
LAASWQQNTHIKPTARHAGTARTLQNLLVRVDLMTIEVPGVMGVLLLRAVL